MFDFAWKFVSQRDWVMSEFAWKVVFVVAGIALAIILLFVTIGFLKWLCGAAIMAGTEVIERLTSLLVAAVNGLIVGLWRVLLGLLTGLWGLLAIGVLAVAAPIKHRLVAWFVALREALKLRVLYFMHGGGRPYRDWVREVLGEAPQDVPHEQEPEFFDEEPTPNRQYQDALEILGFRDAETLTLAALQKRKRELLSLVHEDKGCPSPAFGRMVLEAFETIKLAKGWK